MYGSGETTAGVVSIRELTQESITVTLKNLYTKLPGYPSTVALNNKLYACTLDT